MRARALLPVLVLAVACTGGPSTRPDEGFWPFTAERVNARAPSGDPILVGAIFSTSGGIKWLDTPGLNGFRLAAEEINATGGVRGRPIQVVHVDGKTHPLDIAASVETMLERGVVALGGLLEPTYGLAPLRGAVRLPNGGLVSFDLSSTVRYVAPVAERAGVPVVAAGALAPAAGMFGLSAGFDHLVEAAVDHAVESLRARTAWLLTDDGYRYTAEMAAAFKRHWRARASGDIVTEASFAAGNARHIDEQLDAIRGLDAPPDVILLAAVPNELGILMDEIRAAGIDVPVISAAAYDTPYIVAFAEQRADGLWFSADASLLDPDARVRSFAARYEQAYGRAPEHLGAVQGYDAMRLIGLAIARGGAQPSAVETALAAMRAVPVLGGEVGFTAGATGRRPVAIMRAEDGELRFEQRG